MDLHLLKALQSGHSVFNLYYLQATFYVSHEWTDYSHVQDLYADGHEMASHTISHSHGTNFNEEKWANEVILG